MFCCYIKNKCQEFKSNSIKMNASIEDELKDATWQNAKAFVPNISYGKVIKVYDGDTCTIACKLYNEDTEKQLYRFSVRLNGIDSPEMNSRNENEQKSAHRSQEALSNLILGKIVTLQNVSSEKYGRVLADVYLNDLHINQWMLDNGYAVKYDGGTKQRPNEWNE